MYLIFSRAKSDPRKRLADLELRGGLGCFLPHGSPPILGPTLEIVLLSDEWREERDAHTFGGVYWPERQVYTSMICRTIHSWIVPQCVRSSQGCRGYDGVKFHFGLSNDHSLNKLADYLTPPLVGEIRQSL